MIASPIHKFVILMNPKTGTTSVKSSVGRLGRYAHVRVGGNLHCKHLTYAGYRDMFGDYFDRKGCDVFITVREPLDVLRSWYRFRKSTVRHRGGITVHRYEHDEKVRQTLTTHMHFQDFMDDWAQEAPSFSAHVSCGIDFCLDIHGNIPDEVIFIRYTELSKLADRLSEKFGEQVSLPHLNPSPEIDPNLMTLEDEHKYEKLNEARRIYNRIPFV
ncbi:MAG: hypothetical protein GDA53_11800 [Rhodobacteraceae bacterium]|nr:hypothetical protein [Paracoccaceae bacterium]